MGTSATEQSGINELADSLRTLAQALTVEDAFAVFFAEIQKTFNEVGAMCFDTIDVAEGEFFVTQHFGSNGRNLIDTLDASKSEPSYGGLLSDMIAGKKPCRIDDLDLQDDPVFGNQLLMYRSAIAAPMYDESTIFGWIWVYALFPGAFKESQLERLVLLTNVYGATIMKLQSASRLDQGDSIKRSEYSRTAEIQRTILPLELPEVRGATLAFCQESRGPVCGDMYHIFDFFTNSQQESTPDTRWGLIVADVAATGPVALTVMAILHSIIATFSFKGKSASDLLTYMNNYLCSLNAKELSATVWISIYDPAARKLEYGIAGHPAAIMRRPPLRGEVAISTLNEAEGPALGIDSKAEYKGASIQLAPDDTLLIYTDGIVDATNDDGVKFGIEQLEEILRRSSGEAVDTIERTLRLLRDHEAKMEIDDDQTLIAVHIKY